MQISYLFKLRKPEKKFQKNFTGERVRRKTVGVFNRQNVMCKKLLQYELFSIYIKHTYYWDYKKNMNN
jgi:hypothetical protein